jgi:hypothetical protein
MWLAFYWGRRRPLLCSRLAVLLTAIASPYRGSQGLDSHPVSRTATIMSIPRGAEYDGVGPQVLALS